jgi:regulator of protease activity HflC (stomatin/prohibitin superfamily)
MAHVTRLPFLRHLRAGATVHVRYQRGGRLVREGVGLSFWYRPLTAVLSEIPVDDRELPLLFHASTADFQDVTVQANVTFRISDPELAATRVNFGIDPERGHWTATPLAQLGGLITELAQQYALDLLARTTLRDALVEGVPAVRDRISQGLAADARLAETGVSAVSVRVVAVRPEPDVEKALRTPTRELVQQEADRATYERRAVAVERERAIAENELQNKIELARREEQLVAQQGANERRAVTEAAEAERIRVTAQAERDKLVTAAKVEQDRMLTAAQAERTRELNGAKADGARVVGLAEAEAEAAKLAAVRDLPPAIVLGLALRDLSANLPRISTLNLTPDLLTPILSQLAARDGRPEEARPEARRGGGGRGGER